MFFTYLLLIVVSGSLLVFTLSLRRWDTPGVKSIAFLSLTLFVWSGLYLMQNTRPDMFRDRYVVAGVYIFSAIAASLLVMFSLIFSNRFSSQPQYLFILFVFEPLLGQLLYWNKIYHDPFFVHQVHANGLVDRLGLWPQIHNVYLYNLEALAVLLVVEVFTRRPNSLFFRSGVILGGVFVPLMVRTLSLIGLTNPEIQFELSLFGYAICLLGLVLGLWKSGVVENVPIRLETIVKGMNDGWMVLDLNNRIINLNPAAEKILGISYRDAYGESVLSVLPDWSELTAVAGDDKEIDIRRSWRSREDWHYLNVRVSSLKNNQGKHFGQLIVWRDVTERKQVDDARQRSRDEVLVILNAISNAASNSMSLAEFIKESLYHLIYPFDSQMLAVFMFDENEKKDGYNTLHLISQYGMSFGQGEDNHGYSIPGFVFGQVLDPGEPVLFQRKDDDDRARAFLRELEIVSMLALPMVAESENGPLILGALLLGRKNNRRFTDDELIRLKLIVTHMTNLIDSDRKRQTNIAFSERERLMRDLHDSVSQKLYGLVSLTEAAQAGLEAGSKVPLPDLIVKIGEGARQAVKEMRLFLFEMQPVNFEEESLVQVLHHRLAAVEGRADVQARLVADDKITLSKEKEIAFYYVAQEALNNVLKHAHARNVSVMIKQTRSNSILEIVDDGLGFDMKKLDKGGLGLQNMTVRANQIKGKLKISSKPGAGTKIILVVSREKFRNPKRRDSS